MQRKIILLFLVSLLLMGVAFAQEAEEATSDEAPSDEDLRAKTQNPVGAMYSLPFKFSFDYGAPNGEATFLNIQPVIPVTVGDWNLINRVIAPLIHVPGFINGTPEIPSGAPGDGATGLGDINYSVYMSPAKAGKAIWGIGPSLMMPTATDDQLGSGKWSAGPTVVVLTQPKPWSLGVLARQLWSFSGDDERADVNQFLLEPFVNYNLDKGWYLLTDIIMTANWKADQQWTVPLGGGAGKMFKIGSQNLNTKIEFYYNVERPDNAPKWSWSWTLQFLFPNKIVCDFAQHG